MPCARDSQRALPTCWCRLIRWPFGTPTYNIHHSHGTSSIQEASRPGKLLSPDRWMHTRFPTRSLRERFGLLTFIVSAYLRKRGLQVLIYGMPELQRQNASAFPQKPVRTTAHMQSRAPAPCPHVCLLCCGVLGLPSTRDIPEVQVDAGGAVVRCAPLR